MTDQTHAIARAGGLLVAGIGASAGGLEAMLLMLEHMRPFGRIIYVLAQHMAKDGHDELVVRLLNRNSALAVVLAVQGQALEVDTVYVIPSGKDGTVSGNTLTLHDPVAGSLSTPSVNILFASLAESFQAKAIGVVLSGTGSDGVLGCRSLRMRGGLTLAQSPHQAKFNGMPGAAIEACLIDAVLPAERIGPFLLEKFPGLVVVAPRPAEAHVSLAKCGAEQGDPELAVLLPLVFQATGIDFSSYKEETLLRRLEKRKIALGLTRAEDYRALLYEHPDELKTLQSLFLVSVSSFFRDRKAFSELAMQLSSLLSAKPKGEPINIWVAGCASGEEVYTLAILVNELLGVCRASHPVCIVGTDLNSEALETARAGIFRATAFHEMDSTLRERYFTPKGQDYEICQELREMVKFELRDVLTGEPASLAGKFDLVSCRNLLIYMKSDLQERLVKKFCHALLPQGLLFIGQAESLGLLGNSLFVALDHYHRLYRRRH